MIDRAAARYRRFAAAETRRYSTFRVMVEPDPTISIH